MPVVHLHRAEFLQSRGAKVRNEAAAEDYFRQALDWPIGKERCPGNCAATSFARLLRDQSRSAEAAALLQLVYDRFTEGFDTADLKAAKALLKALAEPAAVRTLGS